MFIVLHLQAVSNPMWWGEEMGNSFLFSFCFSQLLAPDISVFTSSQACEDIRTDQSWQDMGGWGTRDQEENYKRPMSGAESADCSTLHFFRHNALQLHWLGGKFWASKYWPSTITELLYHASKLYVVYQNCTCKWLQTILVLYCVSI